ncbi:MAG: hypothetical protein QOH04_946 [Sphingomonadales bacterium]|jgi:hypothetical protein|nr:hypothetical protein [Sphingomonadales bacterium]
MSVNREIWKLHFEQKSFPGLPCPHCVAGKLKLISDSFCIEEPAFSEAYHSHNDFEPDWVENRFSARLKCDESDCGEIVAMVGDTEIVQVEIDEPNFQGWGLDSVLSPRAVFPGPPLFRIPKNVPFLVAQQLRLAFQLFWSDIPACAGRLRTAVELMLDQQKVSAEKLTKKGKLERMNLAERIEAFAATAAGDDLKDPLHALRQIGNLGAHGTVVTTEALFDAADVLEDVLLGIYEKKSLKAKVKKLTDTKGDY